MFIIVWQYSWLEKAYKSPHFNNNYYWMTIALHDQLASHLWLSLHATWFSTHLSWVQIPLKDSKILPIMRSWCMTHTLISNVKSYCKLCIEDFLIFFCSLFFSFCCKGYRERFVPLQYAIDMAIILEQSNLTQPIPLKLQVSTVRRYHNYFDQKKGVSNVFTNSKF